MRVKQTARKSTGAPQAMYPSSRSSSGSSPSQPERDPVQLRMRNLLQTKRKSATPSQGRNTNEPSTGRGKGKRIPYSNYDAAVKKKPKPKGKQTTLILRDIKRLQKGYQLLIPRAPFHRLIREITMDVNRDNHPEGDEPMLRYQTAALEAIQEAAESYLLNLFEDSYLCTIHAKRVTLFVTDMMLCQRLQKRTNYQQR